MNTLFNKCIKELNETVSWEMVKLYDGTEVPQKSILYINKKKAVYYFDLPKEISDAFVYDKRAGNPGFQFKWIHFTRRDYVKGKYSKYYETVSESGDTPDVETLTGLRSIKTLKALKQFCRDRKIRGFSKYKKEELLRRLVFTLLLNIPLNTKYSKTCP